LLLLALILAGCGGDDGERRAAATATATATATPTTTPAAAPPAEAVRFRAADGKPVRGQFTPAKEPRAPAVVLLHEIRGGPDQWDGLVPYLHEAGFATLAYASRASTQRRERLPDALGALRWLRSRPDVDPRRLALVGASIGASTTVLAMARASTAKAAVALSPPDSADIWDLQDHDRYRPHDVLFIADAAESTSAKGMLDGAVRSRFLQSSGPGHGVALLGESGIRNALLAWLDERVR